MLTRELALVTFDEATGRAFPDRLMRNRDKIYLGYARRMLGIYQRGIGRTRRELHREIEAALAPLDRCPRRRVAAFQKLLDDGGQFASDAARTAAKLRQRVFTAAARFHPLVERDAGMFGNSERQVKERIAAELQMTWAEIDARLFSDVIEFQRLIAFDGYASPEALLARYNVAQTQAAFYRAEQLTVWSRTDHKMILRYAKLAGLMHDIQRLDDGGYRFRFDGPASGLRTSTRYGVAMARLLPGLLTCRDWKAVARLAPYRGRSYRLELDSGQGLHGDAKALAEFDSQIEADFVAAWESQGDCGWTLRREAEILHEGQHVFTPDFALDSADGRRVLLEIVGFWTPEYLTAKARQLVQFQRHPILLAVPAQSRFEPPAGIPPPIIFKRRLSPADVLARLDNRVTVL